MNKLIKPDSTSLGKTGDRGTTPMGTKKNINRNLNVFNLTISVLVFGTGLILLTQFHMGHGAYQKEWLGLGKSFWLIIHQFSAVGFLAGCVVHLQRHWKYITTVIKRWRNNLPGKFKSRTFLQVLLLVTTSVVLWAGFYPWLVMPGATLESAVFHGWIDLHARVGILVLIGMAVHIIRRWRRIVGT